MKFKIKYSGFALFILFMVICYMLAYKLKGSGMQIDILLLLFAGVICIVPNIINTRAIDVGFLEGSYVKKVSDNDELRLETLYKIIGLPFYYLDGIGGMVVYRSMENGEFYIESFSGFNETVDKEKYPNTIQEKKFELVEDNDAEKILNESKE